MTSADTRRGRGSARPVWRVFADAPASPCALDKEYVQLRQFRIPVIASRIKKDFESAHVSSTVSMTVNMEEKMKTSKHSLGIRGSDFLGPMELSSART